MFTQRCCDMAFLPGELSPPWTPTDPASRVRLRAPASPQTQEIEMSEKNRFPHAVAFRIDDPTHGQLERFRFNLAHIQRL